MASLWEILGKAGTAAQNVNNQAIQTAQNKAPEPKTTQVTNTEPVKQKTAQEYAQDALNGVDNRYISPSQAINAQLNAGVLPEIKPVVNDNNKGGGGDGNSDSSGTSAVDSYLSALQQRNAQSQALEEKRRNEKLSALEQRRNEKLAALEEQKKQTLADLETQYGQGKQNISDQATDSNRQAYIAYMQGIKNMPQSTAMYGSGGMVQSLANKSQLNYENNRMGVEKNKMNSLTDLENSYRGKVSEAENLYSQGVLDTNDSYRNSVLNVDDAYYDAMRDAEKNYLTQLANTTMSVSSNAKSTSSGKSSSGKSDGSSSNNGYAIESMGIKTSGKTEADNVLSLYDQLRAQGFTDAEAKYYMQINGIIIE